MEPDGVTRGKGQLNSHRTSSLSINTKLEDASIRCCLFHKIVPQKLSRCFIQIQFKICRKSFGFQADAFVDRLFLSTKTKIDQPAGSHLVFLFVFKHIQLQVFGNQKSFFSRAARKANNRNSNLVYSTRV